MSRGRIDRLTAETVTLAGPHGTLVSRCHVARGLVARAVGLLATPRLEPGEGVVITRCASVHTMFLRASIGVVFVDADGVVVRVADPLGRWRVASARGARAAVEGHAGAFVGLAPGDRLLATDASGHETSPWL